jgi:hypothetical protein
MEMEKSYYVVTYKPAYFELQGMQPGLQRLIIAITQGGFGQDVIDDQRQAKERFLEYLFAADGIDLPRSADVFDQYFQLEPADDLIDLDEEL